MCYQLGEKLRNPTVKFHQRNPFPLTVVARGHNSRNSLAILISLPPTGYAVDDSLQTRLQRVVRLTSRETGDAKNGTLLRGGHPRSGTITSNVGRRWRL